MPCLFSLSCRNHSVIQADKSHVDCGANGGIVGDDMIVLEGKERLWMLVDLMDTKYVNCASLLRKH